MSVHPPLPYLLIALVVIPGCAVTGPADDGWENSQEWVDNGRLLSDEAKILYRSNDSKNPAAAPAADPGSEAYREWQEARERNSAEYQKFKLWQQFEAFRRWKEQQNSE